MLNGTFSFRFLHKLESQPPISKNTLRYLKKSHEERWKINEREYFSIVFWKPRQIRRITYLMLNANSINLEEISCFKLLKKKFVSPQTIARKIPKKFNFSKVTNHPKWDYPVLLFSSVPWNKKRESKHRIKAVKGSQV